MINARHKIFYDALMDSVLLFNGQSTKCDMIDGPCSCGAWHSLEGFRERCRNAWPATVKWIKKELRVKPRKRLYLLIKYGLTRQDAYDIQRDLGIVRGRKGS